MDVGSSSSGTAPVAAPHTASKHVGPPYRKRAKNAVLKDPSLEKVMGSKEKALDVEEFSEDIPPNLDPKDQGHWTRLRKVLFDKKKAEQASRNKNPRSFSTELAHVRHTLRMLQDVSAGTRPKFLISGSQPKRESQGSKINGVAKPKRTKSTKARDNWPNQVGTDVPGPSSSATDQDDDTDAMDHTLTKTESHSAEDIVFETPEERAENDRAMRAMAEQIRKEHPALRSISPDTMQRIGHLVDLGLW